MRSLKPGWYHFIDEHGKSETKGVFSFKWCYCVIDPFICDDFGTVGLCFVQTNAIEELTSVFELLDLEGNGDLDFSEFKLGLTSVGVKLSQEEAIQLYQSIDADS